MVVLISGASHTGKTVLAQKLLEKYHFPYLSLDHLKMGLIRSGQTALTPFDDDQMIEYLWPIVRGIIKTVLENHQNLIVEGCYIPFDWQKDFNDEERRQIKSICLVMSDRYIRGNFQKIKEFAHVIEHRLDDSFCTLESVLEENQKVRGQCLAHCMPYVLIDTEYTVDFEL